MLNLDEPNGKYGRWGQAGSALLTFGILTFVIVVAVLDWLVGAPAWVLLTACAPIAVFSIAWGFTVDDEGEPETAVEPEDHEKLIWEFDRPTGFWGWIRRAVSMWFTFAGLLLLGKLILLDLLGLSESAFVIAALPLLAFALALEFLDLNEADGPDQSTHNTTVHGSANVRFHQSDHEA